MLSILLYKLQGNITATRYRNDVIRSVLLLHIRANLGMGLRIITHLL